MELKEVVNLRKLREYYESSLNSELCVACPFRDVCSSYGVKTLCILTKMLGADAPEKDLYQMEEDDGLPEDYQIRF